MNDPKRWLQEPPDAHPFERRLVLAGKELEPPAGAEEQVWAALLPMLGPGSGGGPGPSAPASPDPGGAGAGGALGGGAGAKGAVVAGKFLALGAAVGLSSVVAVQGVRRAAPLYRPQLSAVAPIANGPGVPLP